MEAIAWKVPLSTATKLSLAGSDKIDDSNGVGPFLRALYVS